MHISVKNTPYTQTAGHKKLHSMLVDMGFIVEDEARIGPYSLDCFLEEVLVGVEYDGEPFHRKGNKKKADYARDTWISEHAGIQVLRCTDETLRDKQEFEKSIDEFIEECTESLSERRATFSNFKFLQ